MDGQMEGETEGITLQLMNETAVSWKEACVDKNALINSVSVLETWHVRAREHKCTHTYIHIRTRMQPYTYTFMYVSTHAL